MKRNYSIVIANTISAFLLSSLALGQQNMTESEARRIASGFVLHFGIQSEEAQMKASILESSPLDRRLWVVEDRDQHWRIGIDDRTRLVRSFSDLKASHDLLERAPTLRQNRVIKSPEQAWQTGESLWKHCHLDNPSFTRGEAILSADEPGANQDRANRADVYALRWIETVPECEGWVNERHMTLDVVTGKVLRLRAERDLLYMPPRHRLSREEALRCLKAVWNDESRRFLSRGGRREHDPFVWPGDESVRHAMVLGVSESSPSPDHSEATQRHERGEVRMAWGFNNGQAAILIDAETGGVLAVSLSKSGYPGKSSQAIRQGEDEAPIGLNVHPNGWADIGRSDTGPTHPISPGNSNWPMAGATFVIAIGVLGYVLVARASKH